MTDQWLSLITPFRDLRYTICYYNELDFDLPKVNSCKSNTSFEIVVSITIIGLSYRILQCMRLGYSQGKYFTAPHFANTIKYSLSLISALLSFYYNIDNENRPLFIFWIIITAISTCYSYYWDLKYDWDLLQSNNHHFLLRKYLTF
jgi:EXS family